MKTKRQVLPLILLLVCILAVSLFYGAQKSGMFIDEVYTFGLSNGYYTPFITDLLEADPILTRQEMTDYLTVSDGDAFCFGSVWYNQTQDVHPPLHYLLIHGISSLFPGSYSKWIGVIPNILLLLAVCVMLYRMALRSFRDRRIALLCAALYGLSSIAVSTAIMVRMYMLLTFLTVMLAWWVLCILQEPRRRHFILAGVTIVLGLLTQYYYVFYAFFLCAACDVYLLAKRRWKDLAWFSCCALGGVAMFCLIYPACFDHLFGEKLVSGGSMLQQLMNFGDHFRRIHTYVYSINFYARVAVRTGVIAILACLPMPKRLLAQLRSGGVRLYPLVLVIPAFAALLLIAIASPVIPLRYAYNLIPLLCYCVCLPVSAAFCVWNDQHKPVRIIKELAAPAAAVLSLVTVLQVTPEFLYPEHTEYTAAARACADAPCIYFNDGYVSPLTQDLPQLLQFEEVFVANDPTSPDLQAYLNAHPDAQQLVVYIDIDPFWSSGFESAPLLMELAPHWTVPEPLYIYGSSEAYVLTRAVPQGENP